MFRRLFGPSLFEREIMAELAKAHKAIENAHSAISSGQLHDKEVEKTLYKFKDDIKEFRDKYPRRQLAFYYYPLYLKGNRNV